jgi:hypothetical protein
LNNFARGLTVKKPDISSVLGALAMGEQEGEDRHKVRTEKVEAKRKQAQEDAPRSAGRPKTDRQQFTITLSPRAVEILEEELLRRMQDKSLKPSEKRPGPAIEALILEAAAQRKRRNA